MWNPIIIMATQFLLLAMGFTPDPPPDQPGVHVEVVGDGGEGHPPHLATPSPVDGH